MRDGGVDSILHSAIRKSIIIVWTNISVIKNLIRLLSIKIKQLKLVHSRKLVNIDFVTRESNGVPLLKRKLIMPKSLILANKTAILEIFERNSKAIRLDKVNTM